METELYFGTSYGHAWKQYLHPMHTSGFTFTIPRHSYEMEPDGHTNMQNGTSKIMNEVEMKTLLPLQR